VPDLSPEAKATWRRWWRSGPPTPRQVADDAFARITTGDEAADTLADAQNLIDPYDYYLLEHATDPLTVQYGKAVRVERGQTSRRIKRRLNANKHRRGGQDDPRATDNFV
jgi:hypothetical protein